VAREDLLPGSPAAAAGIVVGATLVAVDGARVEQLDVAEFVHLLSTSSGKLTLRFRQVEGRSRELVVPKEAEGKRKKTGGS